MTYPAVKVVGHVDLTSPVGKVGQHNAQVHGSGKGTRTQTTDRGRRNLRQVHGADNDRLAHAHARNEASGVDGRHAALVGHEDGNADEPQDAQLPRRPDAAEFVADGKGPIYIVSNHVTLL